jgi:hypothetical protein
VIASAATIMRVALLRDRGTHIAAPSNANAIRPAVRNEDVALDPLRLFVLPKPVVLIVTVIVVALEIAMLFLSKAHAAAVGTFVHDITIGELKPPDGLIWRGI